jgi:hypothetical protein
MITDLPLTEPLVGSWRGPAKLSCTGRGYYEHAGRTAGHTAISVNVEVGLVLVVEAEVVHAPEDLVPLGEVLRMRHRTE